MSEEEPRDYPVLKKPKYEHAKIWRFIDFTKFVSLIDKSALFFPRIDRLGDKFEGSIPKYSQKNYCFVILGKSSM
jgi:hypothetical protein